MGTLFRKVSAVAGLAVLLWMTLVSPAAAFNDLFRFADRAAAGGGGGRFFTSSPADGYGCGVCHGGTPATGIVVRGLPRVYQPNALYDVIVELPVTAKHATALVELTSAGGFGAGLSSVPTEVRSVAEACEPFEQGVPAGVVLTGPDLPITNGRQIVGLQDCGAHALHFTWAAPQLDVGRVVFSGGVVLPDGQNDTAGDSYVRLHFDIASPTDAVKAVELATSCSAGAPGRTRDASPAVVVMLTGICVLWRRWPRSVT